MSKTTTTPTKRSSTLRKLLLLCLLPLCALANQSTVANGALLEHVILPTDSQDSLQTGRVCGILERPGPRLICAAARHLDEPAGKLQLDLLAHANDRGVEVISRFASRKFDKDFFEKLFSEGNFQHASGSVSVIADYAGTEIRLIPVHMMGAFKIGNPSLPNLHLGAAVQSVFLVSQNFFFVENLPVYDLLVTPELFYFDREFSYVDNDILSIASMKTDDIVEQQAVHGVDGNLGFSFIPRSRWAPAFSVRYLNVASPVKPCANDICRNRLIEVEDHFQARSIASLHFTIAHPLGHSLIGAALPFWGYFEEADSLNASATYAYQLLRLKAFVAYAPLSKGFGFSFSPDNYEIGIRYTDEKQDNRLQIERKRQTYVFTNFNI